MFALSDIVVKPQRGTGIGGAATLHSISNFFHECWRVETASMIRFLVHRHSLSSVDTDHHQA
jgi:hypothetical protein